MQRGERTVKLIAAVVVLCGTMGLLAWGVGSGAEEEAAPSNQYQAVAPDLVLDTATGKLTNSQGRVMEQAIDPSATVAGRYSAAGYVTAVTRTVGLNVINQPVVYPELVKGYVIVDAQTGQVVTQRIYYRQALQASDLQ
ncbi:MAG: hypothetical protein ACE149_01730 [Armatimonadota bacterium]